MAKKSVKLNYTKIPNEILETLIKFPLGPRQRQVLDFIIRKTFGYNQNFATIPRHEFLDATGIESSNLNKPIKALFLRNLISIVQKDGKRWPTYGINSNITTWILGHNKKNECSDIYKKPETYKFLPYLDTTSPELYESILRLPYLDTPINVFPYGLYLLLEEKRKKKSEKIKNPVPDSLKKSEPGFPITESENYEVPAAEFEKIIKQIREKAKCKGVD